VSQSVLWLLVYYLQAQINVATSDIRTDADQRSANMREIISNVECKIMTEMRDRLNNVESNTAQRESVIMNELRTVKADVVKTRQETHETLTNVESNMAHLESNMMNKIHDKMREQQEDTQAQINVATSDMNYISL